jgi:hypothetical protein
MKAYDKLAERRHLAPRRERRRLIFILQVLFNIMSVQCQCNKCMYLVHTDVFLLLMLIVYCVADGLKK